MANNIPVAFAVTYLIGVVGAAWFLAQIRASPDGRRPRQGLRRV